MGSWCWVNFELNRKWFSKVKLLWFIRLKVCTTDLCLLMWFDWSLIKQNYYFLKVGQFVLELRHRTLYRPEVVHQVLLPS